MDQIELKTAGQLDLMRSAGLVVARTLGVVAAAAVPGVTTAELDRLAEREIRAAGALPSFLGYFGYPATICTSVNDEVVHGIPSPDRTLRAGDLISIDCGAIVGGWHGDAAVTVGVGALTPEDAALAAACEAALWRGISAAWAGAHLGDIGHAVSAGAGRYGVVREYTGHGIGSQMHMNPVVPNYCVPGTGPRLEPGMAIAIEPMLTLGSPAVVEQPDGWTVVTADGRRAAHFEHTVAITPDGPRVLTALLSRTTEVHRPETCSAREARLRPRGPHPEMPLRPRGPHPAPAPPSPDRPRPPQFPGCPQATLARPAPRPPRLPSCPQATPPVPRLPDLSPYARAPRAAFMLEKCQAVEKAPYLAPFLPESTFPTREALLSCHLSLLRNSSNTSRPQLDLMHQGPGGQPEAIRANRAVEWRGAAGGAEQRAGAGSRGCGVGRRGAGRRGAGREPALAGTGRWPGPGAGGDRALAETGRWPRPGAGGCRAAA